MAKQSGLHQIKGKVEGYSYYRQSGVKDGLMRRINEGLSSRVKTSEEFANTRLNNSEFGNAADVAKVLASVITPKYRPMFLNFSQAKLTKSILARIKQAAGDWGQRALSTSDVQAVCEAVNMLAKNDFSAYCSGVQSMAGDTIGDSALQVDFSQDNVTTLESIGADGVVVKSSFCVIYAGQYSAADHRYNVSQSKVVITDISPKALSELTTGVTVSDGADAPAITGTAKILITLVLLMPYRIINNKEYVLQEKCTFKMVPTIVKES